jgi:Tfp pilus assembly protein PilO
MQRQNNNMDEKKEVSNMESKNVNKDDKVTDELKPEIKKPAVKKAKVKSWIALILVNFIMLTLSIFMLASLPKKAAELNKVRSDEEKVIESKKVDITGLEYKPTKDSVDKLLGYYPEELGLINFIETAEAIKGKGSIKNFYLVGENAVKDKTGAYGIPFIVEFEGSWETIGQSLQELQKLPYLIRAIDVKVETVDEKTISFKYGGFLYVSDKLAKTR